MITNLFSVFDPASAFLSIAWIISLIIPSLVAISIWNTETPALTFNNNITASLYNEISFVLNTPINSQEIILIILFTLIVITNFSALYPQIYSLTSHLTFTLPLSLITWLSIVLFGWLNNTNHILSHLVPQGTPVVLMSFIVIIELTSNLIRPITLCVRLTANLIAGHLLITLLGNSLMSISILSTSLTMIAPLILTVLETAVACIQAYVFITLSTLYITEIN